MLLRLRRKWRLFRQRGVRATTRAICSRIYSAEHYIVTYNLLTTEADDHAGDVRFRPAAASDLDHLEEFEPYGRGSIDRKYVENDGDWLFVACHGDRIVATRRYGRVIRHPLVSRVVRLGEGQVWSADIFCLPEYRNQHIARYLGLFSEAVLRSYGYTDVFGVISVRNAPSLRTTLSKGGRPVYYLSHCRLVFYERLSVSKDVPRRLVGGLARK